MGRTRRSGARVAPSRRSKVEVEIGPAVVERQGKGLRQVMSERVAQAGKDVRTHAEALAAQRRIAAHQARPGGMEDEADPHGTIREAREMAANDDANLNDDSDPFGTIRASRAEALKKRRKR